MAIKDYDGTTKYEIGKLRDYDGTTKYDIGKVYDYDGTTKSLIYSNEYLISDTSTNLWGTPSVGQSGSYNSAYAGGFDGGIHIGVWDCWMGYEDVTFSCPNSISTSGYKTLYITYNYSSSTYGSQKNIGININGTTIDRTFYGNDETGTKTLTYDVSSLSSIKISGYAQVTDVGGCASIDMWIVKSWLE